MSEPEASGCEGDCREEVCGELVVACGDAAEVFELVEEALDEIALAVEFGIDGTLDLTLAQIDELRRGAFLPRSTIVSPASIRARQED